MEEKFTCQEFSSINQKGNADLQLSIIHHGASAVEIIIVNKNYKKQIYSKYKEIAIAICIYGMLSCSLRILSWHRSCFINIFFCLWLIFIAQRMRNIIEKARLMLCKELALQYETVAPLRGRSSYFIVVQHIHDAVLNEVIENLDVHYILIVRAYGEYLDGKHIFPIFNELRPTVDCLHIICTEINKMLLPVS